MTLILSNDDVESVLTIEDTLAVLRSMYADLETGAAVTRPRSDLVVPGGDGDTYSLKTQDGVVPSAGISAVRINSDILSWPEDSRGARREKLPRAGGRWVGLVILFSTSTGAPLAIFPDGVAQRMRVACTSAIAVEALAREDARSLAVIGTGWQAESQLAAANAVRKLDKIRCYSPTKENRDSFAAKMSARVHQDVDPVGTADDAVTGADIVLCATNAIHPVVESHWIRPGVHIGVIKPPEITALLIAEADVSFSHSTLAIPAVIAQRGMLWRESEEQIPDSLSRDDFSRLPDLVDLLSGRVSGRVSPHQSTLFVNNGGLGTQFAALGSIILRESRAAGLGHSLPDEWFTEDVHP